MASDAGGNKYGRRVNTARDGEVVISAGRSFRNEDGDVFEGGTVVVSGGGRVVHVDGDLDLTED